MTAKDLLLANCERSGDCWIWTGDFGRAGYGRVRFEGEEHAAHRFAYATFVGQIPDGLWVLHHCDVRACINPDHLYTGTHADNTRDALERGRFASGDRNSLRKYPELVRRGEAHPITRLTEQLVKHIRAWAAARIPQKAIAERCGISVRTVRNVVKGRTWGHIPFAQTPTDLRRNRIGSNAAKLSWSQVDEIRRRHSEGLASYRELGSEFGVSADAIGLIVTGKTWIRRPPDARAALAALEPSTAQEGT